MSWQKSILDAEFNDVKFEVQQTFDEFSVATVSNEYPYVDGADVTGMGRNGRRIFMTAITYGDDYEARLMNLITALHKPGVGKLIHPIFGEIRAQFSRAGVPHAAEEPDTARCMLEFLESKLGGALFDRVLPVQKVDNIKSGADDVLAAAGEIFGADIMSMNLPALARSKLDGDLLNVMDTMGGYAEQLLEARSWTATGGSYISRPLSFVDELTGGMVSRLKALFSPISLGSGGRTATRYGDNGIGTVWAAPVANLKQPLIADTTNVAPAIVTQVIVQQTVAVAGAAAELYEKELAAGAMTPLEVEAVAADTRTTINEAIAVVEETYPDIVKSRPITEPLKQLALSVTEAAEKLISAKPPLITRIVETPGNLQLLAHFWYGDYRRSDELLRLNPQISNPNFILRGATIRAYAL